MKANRIILAALAAIFVCVLPAAAQTNVIGTILDPTGVPYNTGYINFQLVPSGGPVPCVGTPCTSINGHFGNVSLDASGHFQMNLWANGLITPASTKWQITVSEPGNPAPWCFGPQSFTTALTIPNQATYDISSQLSALAPQLCRNSSASSGCPPLTGIDTGVLFEHPKGTCDDTVKFTWDVTNQNLQSGDGANVVGAHDTWTFGPANDLTGARFAAVVGGSNNINSMSGIALDDEFITVLGSGNSVGDVAHANSGGKDNTIIGNQSALYNASWVQVLGVAGVGVDGGTGTETFGFSVGGANSANCVQGSDCGSTGAGTVTSFGLMGDNNLINWHGSGAISGVYAGGNDNRFDTTIGNISGSVDTIWGFDNEIDGAVGNDVHIFGASNTSHGSSTASCLGASDSYVGGSLNVATSSSNFHIFGAANTVTSRNCAGVYGFNIVPATNNTMYYGISPTAEIQVSSAAAGAAGSTQIAVDFNDNGIVLNKVVKLTGAPSGAIVSVTGDTNGFIGIAVGTAGGTAQVAVIGTAPCVFDGATTAGDYVQNSSGTGGDCHDAGASYPGTGQVLGRVLSTNGGAGTYKILVFSPSR